MKNLWKKVLLIFVMIFSFSTLVACNAEKIENTTTEQNQPTNEEQQPEEQQPAEQPTLDQNQAYVKLNSAAKTMTDKSTAKHEIVATQSQKISMALDEQAFRKDNSLIANILGEEGIQDFLQEFKVIAEEMSSENVVKIVTGIDGETKQGYYEHYNYNETLKDFKKDEATYTIKEGENLAKYRQLINSGEIKEKSYVGEDFAEYEYLFSIDEYEDVGLDTIVNNPTFTEYKADIMNMIERSYPMEITVDLEDYVTISSTIEENDGIYVLKNEAVVTKLPVDYSGISLELTGTNSLNIYFKEDKIERVDAVIKLNSLTTTDDEGIKITFAVEIENVASIIVNEYKKSINLTDEFLAAFKGTGDDQDEDGNADVVKTVGGYIYCEVVNGSFDKDIAVFGDSISMKSASEFAKKVYETENPEIKQYYDFENLKWYTNTSCEEEVKAQLLNKTAAPSYEIYLFTKPNLKSTYTKLNIEVLEGTETYKEFELYLPVAAGDDAINLNIQNVLKTYVNSPEYANVSIHDSVENVWLNGNAINLSSSFISLGGQENTLTFSFEEITKLDSDEIEVMTYVMDEDAYAEYLKGYLYNYSGSIRIFTPENYDESDKSTHSQTLSIAALVQEGDLADDLGSGKITVYLNNQVCSDGLAHEFVAETGCYYVIVIVNGK